MAIRHLLWACPECGTEDALREESTGERCTACGTCYRRGRGATIEAERAGGERVRRSAAEWLDRLPEARPPGRGRRYTERVEARFARGQKAVRKRGAVLGFRARFGPTRPGTLSLTPEAIRFQCDDHVADREWALDALTAVQSSSDTLHFKARGEPVAEILALEGSVRLWTERIKAALRALYQRTGRGEIVEFQPRIVAR